MFIKSNKNDEEEKPLVLFCNPNAVFYEFIHYQTEWFHFYVETLGADLVIFNYRVVLTRNCTYYRVVIYAHKMFIRLPTGLEKVNKNYSSWAFFLDIRK